MEIPSLCRHRESIEIKLNRNAVHGDLICT